MTLHGVLDVFEEGGFSKKCKVPSEGTPDFWVCWDFYVGDSSVSRFSPKDLSQCYLSHHPTS